MSLDRKKNDDGGAEVEYTDAEAAELEEALQRAHRFGEEGDFEAMAEHLRETLESFPGDPFVLCWLGVAERELGLEGIAYERFKQCLAARPEDPHVLATAGNAVAAFDDPAAEAALRTAAMVAPELALGRWLYGAYLIREGLLDEGLKEVQAARTLEPENPEITYELGVALALQGNHEAATDEFFRAAELETRSGTQEETGWTRILLGLALLEQGRVEEAVSELTRGARARPQDVPAQLMASLAAGARSMDDLAWEMLERSRQIGAGADLTLAQQVEDRLEKGPEAARAFLMASLAPTEYRDRLRERP